jgi:hypothetical protein
VRITLVADIPEQSVGPCGIWAKVVDVVKCERKFDDAEVRGEVSAVSADGVEDQASHFAGEGLELFGGELSDVGGRLDGFEQRHPDNSLQSPYDGT